MQEEPNSMWSKSNLSRGCKNEVFMNALQDFQAEWWCRKEWTKSWTSKRQVCFNEYITQFRKRKLLLIIRGTNKSNNIVCLTILSLKHCLWFYENCISRPKTKCCTEQRKGRRYCQKALNKKKHCRNGNPVAIMQLWGRMQVVRINSVFELNLFLLQIKTQLPFCSKITHASFWLCLRVVSVVWKYIWPVACPRPKKPVDV